MFSIVSPISVLALKCRLLRLLALPPLSCSKTISPIVTQHKSQWKTSISCCFRQAVSSNISSSRMTAWTHLKSIASLRHWGKLPPCHLATIGSTSRTWGKYPTGHRHYSSSRSNKRAQPRESTATKIIASFLPPTVESLRWTWESCSWMATDNIKFRGGKQRQPLGW